MDLEQLRRDGYTVVEGVAGPEQIEPLLALAQEASGVVLDDPSTWDPDAPELLDLWDDQAQWDLRQHPPLYEAFAAVYGERELAVSQDRLGLKVPGKRGMRIHHDVDPHDPARTSRTRRGGCSTSRCSRTARGATRDPITSSCGAPGGRTPPSATCRGTMACSRGRRPSSHRSAAG